MEKPKLKNSDASTALLGQVGVQNPLALSILFMLLNAKGGAMYDHEFGRKAGIKKALDTLNRYGLVEFDKTKLFVVRLIESDCVDWKEKRKRAPKQVEESWEDIMTEKGGDVDQFKTLGFVRGESKAAAHYRMELAMNYTKSPEFHAFSVFVSQLFNKYDDPDSMLDNILGMPVQMKYTQFVKGFMKNLDIKWYPELLVKMNSHDTIVKKKWTDFPATLRTWVERKLNQ